MKTRVRITTKENERTMTSDDQELTLRVVPAPGDINTNGHIFGGRVLSQMDIAGGLIASREAAGAVATVAIETLTFIAPILPRAVISIYAPVVHRTSVVQGTRLSVRV